MGETTAIKWTDHTSNTEAATDVCAQVLASEIPLFFKQWGGRTPTAGGDEISIYSNAEARRFHQLPREATS